MANNPLSSENLSNLKDQAAQKLGELKGQGVELTDAAKQKAQQVWDELRSGKFTESTHQKLEELKEHGIHLSDEAKAHAQALLDDVKSGKVSADASQKLDQLKESVKGLWSKVTGGEKA